MGVKVRVRLGCPACGEVLVEPARVTLVVDLATGESTYGFACPSCSSAVRSSATPPTAEMLQGLGAVVDLTAPPS